MNYRTRCLGCRLHLPHGRYISTPHIAATIARPFRAVGRTALAAVRNADARAFVIWLVLLLASAAGIATVPDAPFAAWASGITYGAVSGWYLTRRHYVDRARRASREFDRDLREVLFTHRNAETVEADHV